MVKDWYLPEQADISRSSLLLTSIPSGHGLQTVHHGRVEPIIDAAMSAVRWPVEDHEPHPLVISMPMHVGNMRRYRRRRLRFLYHGTLSSCTKRLMIVSSPPAPIAILSSISFPQMKQQERTGAGAWSTTLCSRTRLGYYMLSGIQVPLAMLNLFAKRHIESQRTADCGKDHVVGVLVLIHGNSGVSA